MHIKCSSIYSPFIKKPFLSEDGFYRSLSIYAEFLLSIFVTLKMLLEVIHVAQLNSLSCGALKNCSPRKDEALPDFAS